VALRSRSRAGDLGDAGAREPGEGRPPVAGRDYRRGDVAPGGVRHAQQGAVRDGSGPRAGRHPPPDAWTPGEEAFHAQGAASGLEVSTGAEGTI